MFSWLIPLLAKVPWFNFTFLIPAVWKNVVKYWRFYLPILLVVVNLFTTYEWRKSDTNLQSERAAHQLDIRNFKQAQADADANAEAVKTKLETESKASAKQADTKYANLLSQYRANLVRYQANQSVAVTAGDSQLQTSTGSNGPSPSSDILISTADADICAVNTARLVAVQQWATQEEAVGTSNR